MPAVIKLQQINKTYGHGEGVFHALQSLDLEIQRGEMLSIIGSSGAGKSTLMNIIGLLDAPSSGQYLLNANQVENISDDERSAIRNREIGFVFQSFFLLPRLSAIENICLPLIYRGTKQRVAIEKATSLMQKLNITRLVNNKPNQLSGGQQQRVAIARALIGEPSVILADEPTGALDSKTGEEVMQLFLQLNQQENVTVIIVTHDKAVAKRCQRVVEIQDGRIVV
ncbi:MAG: ABC transporter ATP-binding protein [Pseudomonadota bacterium]